MHDDIDRSLIRHSTAELTSFATSHWDDATCLQELLAELTFRTRNKAQQLRSLSIARLVEIQVANPSFRWPSTGAPAGDGSLEDVHEWPREGLLRYLGYRVGQAGIDMESRRDILDAVYTKAIPLVDSAKYMAEWGSPLTADRLKKCAHSIASFTRNRKRLMSNSNDTAINDWEGDLEYLRLKYYVNRYDGTTPRFDWPSTELVN